MLKNTLIALLGDHGESLGEHREDDHGYYVYDATLRIPFLLHSPGQLPAGKVVSHQVQTVDVLPTLAALMNFKIQQPVQGKTLMPLIRGEQSYGQRFAYAESMTPRLYYGWSDLKAIRTGEWKYIEAPEPELYNLVKDPGEKNNVVASHPTVVRELKNALMDFLKVQPAQTQEASLDPERLEQLAALGYVGLRNPMETTGTESSIDPKSKIEDYRLIHALVPEAVRFMNRANYKAGLERFNKVKARFPNSFLLNWYLGYCYANLGDLQLAEKAYVKSIQLNPLFGKAYSELALTLALLGRHGDGIKLLEEAPTESLSTSDRDLIKGEIHTNAGAFDKAEASYGAALQSDPENSEARYGLARVYLATKRVNEAIGLMDTLADQGYPSEDVYDSLASIFEKQGDLARSRKSYERWLEIFPNSAAANYRFAQFLQRQGQAQQAAAYFKKALELRAMTPP